MTQVLTCSLHTKSLQLFTCLMCTKLPTYLPTYLPRPAIKKRALKIAKRLGMSVELTSEHFEASGYLGAGGVKITRADRQLISLGRALLMNPELIICHKPSKVIPIPKP